MTQQTSPFVDAAFGWALGESNWNLGADENWLKFSYLHDRNLDGIVASLPAAVNGTAYFNTTDNLVYYVVNNVYHSSPVPKWFEFTLRTTGDIYTFNGTTLALGSSTLLRNDLATSNNAAKGSSLVGFFPAGTGAVGRNVQSKLRETVSVKDFGAVGDGIADDTVALQAARDYIAAQTIKPVLVFPSGIYRYSVSPNWAIQDAVIESQGEVRLRYFGTGNAVIIDHGPTVATYLFNVTMGKFIVECPSTAQHGVYVRSIHHSKLTFRVQGAGTAYAGIKVDFAVCTDFSNCSVTSAGPGNWYLSSRPKHGLWLAKRNAGEQVSYCLFNNCIFEGLTTATGAGILLEGTLGNIFTGGTSEACEHGLVTTTEAIQNRFYGTDFEANTMRDILEQGQGQEFHGVDSESLTTIGAVALFPKFFGGNYQNVEIATGAKSSLFSGISVSRFPSGGFTNGEPSTIFRACVDVQTQKITPLTQASITVGASPFTYTNATGNDQRVSITGGTISSIAIVRNATSNNIDPSTHFPVLSPDDALVVTYSVAPVMYQYSA